MDPPNAINFPMQFNESTIVALPPNSTVAVLHLIGSLCPIHASHVLTLTEGKAILLSRTPTYCSPIVGAPIVHGIDAVIGIITLNSDSHVSKKMKGLYITYMIR